MKVKAGDKVTIVDQPTLTMVEPMYEFLGKTVTVWKTILDGSRFHIEEDEIGWIFTVDDIVKHKPEEISKAKKALRLYAKLFVILAITFVTYHVVNFVSYEYCHGSSHNARGSYCETVYRNEPGYRALPSKW